MRRSSGAGIVLGAGVIVAASVGLVALIAIAGWAGRKPDLSSGNPAGNSDFWPGSDYTGG